MAMTATVEPLGADLLVRIVGTAVGTSEVVEISGLPEKLRMIRHKAEMSGGSVGTFEPVLTRDAADLTGIAVEMRATPIGADASPALPLLVDVQPLNPIRVLASGNTPGGPAGIASIWYAPQPDTGDGSIVAEFIFRAGWGA